MPEQPEEQVTDAEVVGDEPMPPATPTPGAQLVPASPAPGEATLFHTDDPEQVLERATKTATALKKVLDQQGLTSKIQNRDHVNVEGWQTLGAMLGVTPVLVSTQPVYAPGTDNEKIGWEARVEARTLDGRVVGAADGQCLAAEKQGANSTWGQREDFARRSMAQTRATSRALSSVLRFVVTLAGYTGTPAEEMPEDETPPLGPAVSKGDNTKASKALAFLLGPEAERVWGEIKSSCDGYMPAAVAHAVILVAKTKKEMEE